MAAPPVAVYLRGALEAPQDPVAVAELLAVVVSLYYGFILGAGSVAAILIAFSKGLQGAGAT
jgi:hypothetical protein